MLQPTISRSLRSKLTLSISPSTWIPTAPCKACACLCGNVFISVPASSQRRYAEWSRSGWSRAPSTKRRNRPRPKTGTKERGEAELEESLRMRYVDLDVSGFYVAFCEEADRTRNAMTMEPTKLRNLMQHYELEDIDAVNVAHMMWSNYSPDIRYYGQKMLLSLARAEVLEATIRVMSHARLQHKSDKQMLRSSIIEHARAHLAKAADQKQHYRAMVCEGRVALELGNEERAIEMYTDAMAAAVAAAEEDDRMSKAYTGKLAERIGGDELGLSSPWIDLFLLHQYRSQHKGKDEWEKCRWAMEVGCQQDDPISHYNASTYVSKYMYLEGHKRVHLPTSQWMYHVTKAALSMHPVAAFELGVFYAESGWKYLEQDEPPDHVKPTPFDSYPSRPRSLWRDLLMLLGLEQAPKLQPHEGIYLTAAFPDTAVDRYKMALEWLSIASRKGYAPAFLFQAQMLLQQNLWAEADAPQSAMELSDERYKYASKEDFDNDLAIEKNDSDQAASPDPPNPFHAPEEAKWFLREVFYAHESFMYADQAKRAKAKARLAGRVSKTDSEDNVEHEFHYNKISRNIAKWFRFPEVRDMYADQIENLYREAKSLCDTHVLDIYDDDQSLIYRAGTNVGRQTKNLKWWGVHAGSGTSAARRG